jgi:hypothetical protein
MCPIPMVLTLHLSLSCLPLIDILSPVGASSKGGDAASTLRDALSTSGVAIIPRVDTDASKSKEGEEREERERKERRRAKLKGRRITWGTPLGKQRGKAFHLIIHLAHHDLHWLRGCGSLGLN